MLTLNDGMESCERLEGRTDLELELSFVVSSSKRPSASPVSGTAISQVLWSDGIVDVWGETGTEGAERDGEDGEQAKSVGDPMMEYGPRVRSRHVTLTSWTAPDQEFECTLSK